MNLRLAKGAHCARQGRWLRLSCGLFLAISLAAQDGPIDIRAEVFAAHCAIGGALNERAMFSSQRTQAMYPLMNHAGGHVKRARQTGLTTQDDRRLLDRFFRHGANVALLHWFDQAMLYIFFHSIAK